MSKYDKKENLNSAKDSMQTSPVQDWIKDGLRIILIALAYFAAHRIAFLFPDTEKILAAVWPAGGIGLAALLLNRRRLWPAIILALFIAGSTANLLAGRPLFSSIGFMTANILESLACAWIIIRWCGEGVTFNRVKEVLALIFAAIFINGCTAFVGAGTASLAGIAPFWSFWEMWWVADGLGILIVTPLIVAWSSARIALLRLHWYKALESGVFMSVWIVVSSQAFQIHTTYNSFTPQPYVLLVLLAYAPLRLGQRGVSTALSILAVIAIISEAVITGPLLWGGDTPTARLLTVQIFLASIACSGFLLTATYEESRSAEKAAREDQARVRALGDNIPNGMVYQVVREHDGNMRFLYVSGGVEILNGISARDVLRDSSALYNMILEEDRQRIVSAEEISAKDMKPFTSVVRMRCTDGKVRWMQLASSPRRLDDGRILWDGIQMDVTEREDAEDAIKQSEKRFRALVENSGDALTLINADGSVIYEGPTVQRLTGYHPEERIGKNGLGNVYPDDLPIVKAIFGRLMSVAGSSESAQFRSVRKDGTIWWTEATAANMLNDPAVHAIVINYRDITERKRAEEALRESEAALKQAQRVTHVGNWVWHIQENRLEWSDEMYRIFGYEKESFSGRLDEVMASAIHPDDRAEVERSNTSVIKDRKPIPLEYRVIRPDGTIRTVWAEAGQLILDEKGEPSILTGIVQDITERKQAEAQLRASEEKSREIIDQSLDGIMISDENCNIAIWNKSIVSITGIQPRDAIGKPVWEIIFQMAPDEIKTPELLEQQKATMTDILEMKIDFPGRTWDQELMTADGTRKIVQDTSFLIKSANSTRFGSILRDITERRQAEESLRDSEEKFSVAFKTSPYAITITQPKDGMFIEVNDAFHTMTGFTRAETENNASIGMGLWVDGEDRNCVVKELLGGGEVVGREFEFKKKNGEIMIGLFSAQFIHIKNNTYILSSINDITERKQAEETLRESEEKYRRLFDNTTLGIFQSTPQGKAISVNHAFARMFGYDTPEDAIKSIKNVATDVFADSNRRTEIMRLMADNPDLRTFENVYRRKDGSTFTGSLNTMPVRDSDGALIRIEGIVEDITERKQAEDALTKSETMLKRVLRNRLTQAPWMSCVRGALS